MWGNSGLHQACEGMLSLELWSRDRSLSLIRVSQAQVSSM